MEWWVMENLLFETQPVDITSDGCKLMKCAPMNKAGKTVFGERLSATIGRKVSTIWS